MKVIWLTSWYPNPLRPFDGDFIQRHAKAVSEFMHVSVFYVDQSGHKVTIPESTVLKRRYDNLTERVIFFRYKPTGIDLLDKIRYNYLYFRNYKRTLRKYFDKKGKPDLVHIHIPMKAGMIARWLKKTFNIPYIISEQSGHYRMNSADDFFKKPARHRKQVEGIFKNATAVTNVSEAIGETLKDEFQLHSVIPVRNTVDTHLFHYHPKTISPFRFIHVSTLNEHQKNIHGIIEAVEELAKLSTDFIFVMVGPVTKKLRSLVEERNLTNWIQFTGEVPYENVAREMQASNTLVLFSNYENFPCVIVEALCAGLTVVSSDIGGVKEAVNKDNGLLVPPTNVAELTNAMFTMIKTYDNYNREAISAKAQDLYRYETIGRQFVELYKHVLFSGSDSL